MMQRVIGFFVLSLFWLACSNNDQSARLEVRLTDAPGDYEEVNIDIQGVEVHSEQGNQTGGWKSLNVESGIYDLLELTNGLDTLIASAELPAGRISQIRLILGDNNSVTVDGQETSINSPSGQQSGLKLNVQADLTEGITYKILLDFDAARSIVKSGDGYNLKPVIHALSEAASGAIKGIVDPISSSPAVFAIFEGDTVSSTYANETGEFLLRGVPEGSYTVSFSPQDGYEPLQKENVIVTIGNVNDLGTVVIQ